MLNEYREGSKSYNEEGEWESEEKGGERGKGCVEKGGRGGITKVDRI